MLQAGGPLTIPRHRQDEVDVDVVMTDERGPGLPIELVGDLARKGPGKHRQIDLLGGLRGGDVVGVPGDPRGVEDHQAVGVVSGDGGVDLVDQDGPAHGVEGAVRVVGQFSGLHSEGQGSIPEFGHSYRGQVPRGVLKCRGLALGQAQHRDPRPGPHVRAQHGTQTEGLVVGMGHHRQDAISGAELGSGHGD